MRARHVFGVWALGFGGSGFGVLVATMCAGEIPQLCLGAATTGIHTVRTAVRENVSVKVAPQGVCGVGGRGERADLLTIS